MEAHFLSDQELLLMRQAWRMGHGGQASKPGLGEASGEMACAGVRLGV